MKMMDEIERKKMINSVLGYGGIGLRRQVLRIHKNGAKFPISKNYIDDEVLNPNNTYTIILIPEIKIATEISLLLSFFARKKGPSLFYSYPEKALSENEKINIIQNFDQAYKNEFFIHQSSTIPVSLNYYFEIPSEWARGNKEMLLISIITNEQITPILQEFLQSLCIDFVTQLKSDDNSFKGIYYNQIEKFSEKEQLEIKIYNNALKERIKKFYIQIIQTLQS
ncbi:MAG: hypothetical protein ACFFCM_19175 [Promethearchaeota archaeon]